MRKRNSHSFKNVFRRTNKAQDTIKERVYKHLQNSSSTTKMISVKLGIKVCSLCSPIRILEKEGTLRKVEKERCGITGNKAFYLTTR